tara:strand:+ start:19623 stop:22193 length:2571 start_codon:yes stop_codon:yes gene_type:complete
MLSLMFILLTVVAGRQNAVAQVSNKVAVSEAASSFKGLDVDGDGLLSSVEYVSGNRKVGKRRGRDFAFGDQNGDGALSFEEYLALPSVVPMNQRGALVDQLAEEVASIRAGLAEAWSEWDGNGDKVLDQNEFAAASLNKHPGVPAGLEFAHWDRDGNSQVSLAEADLLLDVSYGLRRPEGESIRLPSGVFIRWNRFQRFDCGTKPPTAPDGRISREEFLYHRNSDQSEDAQGAVFDQLDGNSDGVLTFTEWSDFSTLPAYQSRFVDTSEWFLQSDRDYDGKLSRAELIRGTESWDQFLVQDVFPGFDQDGDGLLSFAEFRDTPAVNQVYEWRTPLRDRDQDGYISLDEFRRGEPLPMLTSVFQKYFQRYDVNEDGLLDLSEMPFETSARDPEAEYRRLTRVIDNDPETLTLEEYLRIRRDTEAATRDFRVFDQDASGSLSFAEYNAIPEHNPPTIRRTHKDPVTNLVQSRFESLLEQWLDWDANGNDQLDQSEWSKSQPGRQLDGLELTTFADWDQNADGSISRPEGQRLLEVAFGVTTIRGEPLREPSGVVYDLGEFERRDQDDNGLISLEEQLKRYGSNTARAREEFTKLDQDTNGQVNFAEWSTVRDFQVDPVRAFLTSDQNLDGLLDEAEIVSRLPSYKRLFGAAVLPAFDADNDKHLNLTEYLLSPLANPFCRWWERRKDTTNDGVLSPTEFHWNQTYAQAGLTRFYFHQFDKNKDTAISRNELPFSVTHRRLSTEALFSYLDRDESGSLSLDEIVVELWRGKGTTIAKVEDSFSQADSNTDTFLSMQEFRSPAGNLTVYPERRMKNSGSEKFWLRPDRASTPGSFGRQWIIVAINVVVVFCILFYTWRRR